jgi:2-methylcitrate dehydratase
LEYAVARAILDHHIGPRQFTPEKIHDPALKSLIEKINPTYYERSPVQSSGEWTRLPVEIKIQMHNGKVFSGSVDAPKGSPRNPLAPEDLEEKFRQCCQGKLSESRIRESQDRLRALEKETDVADLVSSWREFTS